ncbi:formate hydrogenlyase complex iron-sulfur subunit [Izhakiella australiensis]|uniref:Formate hydrogenlyase complex iron-sulfur subunit n=1 Tax=Izhakiella australiensis TaxID=1926881 RepID=A0A1S8YMS2_9GAMM|nr:formate hydrogenlyase complex iron-sulfur subunit [Izhakiella australiensis]OON40107.1 formate hydrogenlyase complex iron-sulfur subunit [Izhakiella australiensis]
MFNFLKKTLKTGVVTERYPLAPLAVDKNLRGRPQHNSQQCIGCAACINACPSNALTVATDSQSNRLQWQLNLGRCIFCGRCEEVCPTTAIRLSTEFELAVWQKADLLQQASFALCSCRVCHQPWAVQKEIDYVIAMLRQNGDEYAESQRESFETCPACKRRQGLMAAQSGLGRAVREAC